jgi:RNA polymerase sigma factor (sigma-70 family)
VPPSPLSFSGVRAGLGPAAEVTARESKGGLRRLVARAAQEVARAFESLPALYGRAPCGPGSEFWPPGCFAMARGVREQTLCEVPLTGEDFATMHPDDGQPDDRRLVDLCLGGQPQRFGALYDRHGPRVFRLLRRLTGSQTAAEDLTQETFLAAFRGLSSWRGEGLLGTWLCGIAVRLYRNASRREAPRATDTLEGQDDLPALDGDPYRDLSRRELQERLDVAVQALPAPGGAPRPGAGSDSGTRPNPGRRA